MEDGPLSPRVHLDPTVLNLPRFTSCRLRLQLWKEERFLQKRKRLRRAPPGLQQLLLHNQRGYPIACQHSTAAAGKPRSEEVGGPLQTTFVPLSCPHWEWGASSVLVGGWVRKPVAADRPWNLPHPS